MGPDPAGSSWYDPARVQVATLKCPSAGPSIDNFGKTNYAWCYGDAGVASLWSTGEAQQRDSARGFQRQNQRGERKLAFRDIIDGTSNTIAMGEIGTSVGNRAVNGNFINNTGGWDTYTLNPLQNCQLANVDVSRPKFYNPTIPFGRGGNSGVNDRRGRRWISGMLVDAAFHTVLAPNQAGCMYGAEWANGLMTAGSEHPGGVHVLMGDGAVTFISETIDAGDQTQPMVYTTSVNPPGSASPYGVWGALGTINAKEPVSLPQ